MTEEIVIGDQPTEKKEKVARKRKSRASWKPANVFEIPERFKDPNFTYRGVNWQRAGRVLQKQNEGWIIDKEITKKMQDEGLLDLPTLDDGAPQDGTLRFRELVVMRLPMELKEARKKYYQEANPLRQKIQEENDDLAHKTGGRSYGNISIKKGE